MITIHMTTYARYGSGLLPGAVESVLSQDFTDFEFVICVDGTAGYLQRITARDPRVRVVRNPRNVNSVSLSLGRCFLEAGPERTYVTWMFDDCVMLPGAPLLLAEGIRRAEVDMLFGPTVVRLANGGVLIVGDQPADRIRDGVAASSILVPNAGILIHRRVFEEVGWYDPSIVLRRSCDWDLFRRIIGAGVSFTTIPDILVEENGDVQSDSLRNTFTTTFELMEKYAAARNAAGVKLNVQNCMTMSPHWIPPGAWTRNELALMQFMFLEYYLSIGDLAQALTWAKRLEPQLAKPSLITSNLRREGESREDGAPLSLGAYCGVMFGLFKQQLAQGMTAS